jgi:hypothetical protein
LSTKNVTPASPSPAALSSSPVAPATPSPAAPSSSLATPSPVSAVYPNKTFLKLSLNLKMVLKNIEYRKNCFLTILQQTKIIKTVINLQKPLQNIVDFSIFNPHLFIYFHLQSNKQR